MSDNTKRVTYEEMLVFVQSMTLAGWCVAENCQAEDIPVEVVAKLCYMSEVALARLVEPQQEFGPLN